MVKTQELFFLLPRNGEPNVVLRSRSFDFFIIGLTELVSAPPALEHLVGYQFASFSQAAAEIDVLLNGKSECRKRGHCRHEYHVCCRTALDSSAVGTDELRFASRGGHKSRQPYSPALATTCVEFSPGGDMRTGMTFPICALMPFVPISMSDDDVEIRLAREVRPPSPPPPARAMLGSLDLATVHPF